ncbi:MAG: hypothetical protein QXQ77_01845 [Candidatus Aenigmatarchaeota archaeon]
MTKYILQIQVLQNLFEELREFIQGTKINLKKMLEKSESSFRPCRKKDEEKVREIKVLALSEKNEIIGGGKVNLLHICYRWGY